MEDLVLIDAVERYLAGGMSQEEKLAFEERRKNNPELDQWVVEQQLLIGQLENYGQRRQFKHHLHALHQQLLDTGEIKETNGETGGATIIQLWRKYKRTVAVAASIAGITALSTSGVLHVFSTKPTESNLEQLRRKISQQDAKINEQSRQINQLYAQPIAPKSPEAPQKSGGSSFLIDGSGYLITNAHVVKGASTLIVVNKGHEYVARSVFNDVQSDIAILKIEDHDWKTINTLPYAIRKTTVDLGEEIFTLGFPRNEVVYNRGYMSARSGYNDDTLSIQIAIGANPGNSGGPLLDKNGDIIGILSTRDKQANEVVFASKAGNIVKAIEQLKKDSANLKIKIPMVSLLKGMDRVQQNKKLEDCVFMVKGY